MTLKDPGFILLSNSNTTLSKWNCSLQERLIQRRAEEIEKDILFKFHVTSLKSLHFEAHQEINICRYGGSMWILVGEVGSLHTSSL